MQSQPKWSSPGEDSNPGLGMVGIQIISVADNFRFASGSATSIQGVTVIRKGRFATGDAPHEKDVDVDVDVDVYVDVDVDVDVNCGCGCRCGCGRGRGRGRGSE